MLGWALSVFALMLVSCASEPSATTTTTRQTTGTTPTAALGRSPNMPISHPPGGLVPPGQGTEMRGY
jgi:hypothetical protein